MSHCLGDSQLQQCYIMVHIEETLADTDSLPSLEHVAVLLVPASALHDDYD